jgi:hypothetical protein
VRWPVRRLSFAIERERRETNGGNPVAVFHFLSEDWSPWIALLRMRWPELSSELVPRYLHTI